MRTSSLVGGAGAIAFGVLAFVGMVIANPPGGSYSAHDAAKYVAKGHRATVIVSIYVVLAAVVGLMALLVRLREAVQGPRLRRAFWGLGVAATSAYLVGWALVAATPLALTYGGKGVSLSPELTFTLAEVGWVVMYGAGGMLLGTALIAFALGPVAVPAWFRWATLVAGVAGLAAPAWFPFFLVFIWGVVAGVWLIVAGREPAHAAEPQPA
jgi:hypothetical protein